MASYKPAAPPIITPQEAAHAKASVMQVRRTLAKISKAAAQGRKESFEVKLSENDLTEFVSTDKRFKAKLAAAGLKNPRIQFRDDLVIVSGLTRFKGRQVYVTVNGTPEAGKDGYLELANTKAYVGRLDVTPILAARVEDKIDELFRSGETRVPPGLDTIEARNGFLTMRGSSL